MNEFQERLQELLDDNKLSRLQLSKKLGVTSTTINGYFNRNYYPELSIALGMAKCFNCSLDYLFGLCDNKVSLYDNNNTFFENFNKLIKLHNISIAKAMSDMNMSEQNYYRWRDGTFPITSILIVIAKYFDTSVDYLVGDKKFYN